MKTNTLYVTGLDPSIEENKLRAEFTKHGSVERVTIIKDKVTREPKGFAYVLFSSDQDATAAMKEMDGRIMADKPIKVKYSYSETPEWVSILENRGRGGAPRGQLRGGGRGALGRGAPRGSSSRGMSRGAPRGGSGRGGSIDRGDVMSDRSELPRRGGPPLRGGGDFEGRPPPRRLPLNDYDDEPVVKRSRVDPDPYAPRERAVSRDLYDDRSVTRRGSAYVEDSYAPRRDERYPARIREEDPYRPISQQDPYAERPLHHTAIDDYYDGPERRSEGRRLLPPAEGRRLPTEGRRLPPPEERRTVPITEGILEPKPLMKGDEYGERRLEDRGYPPARKPIAPPHSRLGGGYPVQRESEADLWSASEYGAPRNGATERYGARAPYTESSGRGRLPESSLHGRVRPTETTSRYPSERTSGVPPYSRVPERGGGYVGYGDDHAERDPYAELSKPAATAAPRKYQDYYAGY